MASVDELNQIASVVTSTGYISFDELPKEEEIKILKFGLYKSNFFGKDRDCVRAFVEEGFLILPERFDQSLNKMLNMNTNNLYLIYHGRSGKGPNKRINISFIEKNNNNDKKKNQK